MTNVAGDGALRRDPRGRNQVRLKSRQTRQIRVRPGERYVALVNCSDITNTLVGISSETVPGGGNLCIYYVHSAAIYETVVQIHS